MVVGAVLGAVGWGCGLLALGSNPSLLSGGVSTLAWALLALVVGGLGALAFVVGAFLYVFTPAFRRDLAGYRYGSHVTVMSAVIAGVVLSNVIVGLIMLLGVVGAPFRVQMLMADSSPTIEGLVVAAAALDFSWLLIVYLRIIRPGVITWSKMGITSTSLAGRVGIGLLVGVGLLVVSGMLEYLLRLAGVQQTQMEMFSAVREASLPQFLLFLAVVGVLAPLAEEAFFRGYVFSAYREQKGLWQAFLFSSAIFAVMHLNLPAVLPLFVLGAALAGTYQLTGSLVPAIVAHGVNNSVAILLLYVVRV